MAQLYWVSNIISGIIAAVVLIYLLSDKLTVAVIAWAIIIQALAIILRPRPA